MNAAQTGVENLDIEKLNDKDKAELRQFLANEQQRSQIQSHIHVPVPILLAIRCVNFAVDSHLVKCVTGNIKNAKLDRTEEGCLANCVDRFLDMNFLTMKHLNNMRSS